MRDLRISVTDRCNFRCIYCAPEDYRFKFDKKKILTLEEIYQVAKIFVESGIKKIRITGGEPLLRKDIEKLFFMLKELKPLVKLCLTTNGYYINEKLEAIAETIDVINISLDTLQPEKYAKICRSNPESFHRVIDGILKVRERVKTKINMVVMRGINETEIYSMLDFSIKNGLHLRYIEFMPLDGYGMWNREKCVLQNEIVDALKKHGDVERTGKSSTSIIYKFNSYEFGVIASVSEPFCDSCTRIRILSDGTIRTCLFGVIGYNIRDLIREKKYEEIKEIIKKAWSMKEKGHGIGTPDFRPPQMPMIAVGG